MAYLFDSDILSALTTLPPNRGVQQRIAVVPIEDQYTTTITLGEMLYGAFRVGRAELLTRIERLFQLTTILPFDEPAARTYARLKSDLERFGTPIAEPDLRIASIVLASGLTLVTGNVRHFAHIPGLVIENWLH